jgi:hypothetical protein
LKILNTTKNTIIASQGWIARGTLERMTGLLGRSSFGEEEALVLTACRSIHMFFMKFPIDVIFADKNDIVVGCVERIKPFCLSPYFFRASYAVELSAGIIARSQTRAGDKISLV